MAKIIVIILCHSNKCDKNTHLFVHCQDLLSTTVFQALHNAPDIQRKEKYQNLGLQWP